MREWMRKRMKKRSKRGPNLSESTGKIGQELPASGPAPLSPSYLDEGHKEPHVDEESESASVPAEAAHKPSDGAKKRRRTARPAPAAKGAEVPAAGNLVVETQPESPSVPPPEAEAAAPAGSKQGPRGFVVLAIGLPGSGKTTWFKRRGVQPLSSDMLRSILFDDITEQRYQGLVFSTLRSLLRARLIAKMPWNYVDATNLSPHERRQWIKMAKSFGYEVQAVFFDVPLEVCMQRNSRRERVVNEEIMRKMADRLRPPSFKEGFTKITVVRVKGSAASTPLPEAPAAE